MGARPMARVIADAVKKPLANEILFGKLTGGGVARIDVAGGEIVIVCEPAPPRSADDGDGN
jgi:ATP-dependent Clp protease ATP-binding subunit ClpA